MICIIIQLVIQTKLMMSHYRCIACYTISDMTKVMMSHYRCITIKRHIQEPSGKIRYTVKLKTFRPNCSDRNGLAEKLRTQNFRMLFQEVRTFSFCIIQRCLCKPKVSTKGGSTDRLRKLTTSGHLFSLRTMF